MKNHDLEKEWQRLNRLGRDGCPGNIALRIKKMDSIANKIGYPSTGDLYATGNKESDT